MSLVSGTYQNVRWTMVYHWWNFQVILWISLWDIERTKLLLFTVFLTLCDYARFKVFERASVFNGSWTIGNKWALLGMLSGSQFMVKKCVFSFYVGYARKNSCARILVWNARNGLKHMLINSLSHFVHFEILTRIYAVNTRAARAVNRSNSSDQNSLRSYSISIHIDNSLRRYDQSCVFTKRRLDDVIAMSRDSKVSWI